VDDAASGEDGVEVPYARLAPDVLRRLAEEFVTRDGTDYGAAEKTLDAKVSALRRQLESGEVVIVYDAQSETTNILRRETIMGDKSPKSKHRDQQHKDVAKVGDAAAAKAKQDANSHVVVLPKAKGRG
jgi:uncharacterized protein YheU (UPF0270 family)